MNREAALFRFSSISGYAASAVMITMMVLLSPIGRRALLIEAPYPVEAFTNLIDESGRRIATVLAFDDVFIMLYLGFFLGLACLGCRKAPLLAWLGLGAGIIAGLADFVENARLMAMISDVAAGYGVTPAEAQQTFVIAQVKFCSAYLSLFCFSVGVWPQGGLGRVLAVLFVAFACGGPFAFVNGVMGVLRVPLMALGLGLGGLVLGREAKTCLSQA